MPKLVVYSSFHIMMYNHFYSFYPSNSLHEVLYEQMERQSLLQGACSIFFLLNHIFYSRKKIQRKIHDQPWYKYWSISVFPVLEHCRMYTFQKCFFLKEKCWISSVDHVKKKKQSLHADLQLDGFFLNQVLNNILGNIFLLMVYVRASFTSLFLRL